MDRIYKGPKIVKPTIPSY